MISYDLNNFLSTALIGSNVSSLFFSQSKIKIFAENLENNTLNLRLIDYVKSFIRIQ